MNETVDLLRRIMRLMNVLEAGMLSQHIEEQRSSSARRVVDAGEALRRERLAGRLGRYPCQYDVVQALDDAGAALRDCDGESCPSCSDICDPRPTPGTLAHAVAEAKAAGYVAVKSATGRHALELWAPNTEDDPRVAFEGTRISCYNGTGTLRWRCSLHKPLTRREALVTALGAVGDQDCLLVSCIEPTGKYPTWLVQGFTDWKGYDRGWEVLVDSVTGKAEVQDG